MKKYGDYTKFTFINDEERGIYNYLYAGRGKEAADEYLDYLEETLNYRYGLATAKDKTTPFRQIMYAIPAGMERFGRGIAQLFSEEALPTSYTQYASEEIRQKQSGAGRVIYDALESISQNTPSILLSVLTGGGASALGLGTKAASTAGTVAGLGSMAGSASGNAYNQAIKDGYEPGEARIYAALIGASEGGMQYLLGGFSKLGGVIGTKQLAARIAGIDNVFGRVAASAGSSMLREGSEEALQEIMQPVYESLVFDKKFEASELQDVMYSFLLGALSAGVMEGGGHISADRSVSRTGANFRELGDDAIRSIIDTGLQSGADTTSYRVAKLLEEKAAKGETITDYELGMLYGENVATAAASDKAERKQQDAAVKSWLRAADSRLGEVESVKPDARINLQTAAEADITRRVEAATNETRKSGILHGATDEAVSQAERLGKVMGREIIFYSKAAGENGVENGYYHEGKIHINTKSENPLAQIFSHELTHSSELSESYQALSDFAMWDMARRGADIGQMRERTAELYARNNKRLEDSAEIDKEIVAEYAAQHLFGDEQSIRDMVRRNRPLGERILRWIDSLLARLGNSGAQERVYLRQARETYVRALALSQPDIANASVADANNEQSTAVSAETTDARTDDQRAELLPGRENNERLEPEPEQSSADTELKVDKSSETENDEYLLALRDQLANGEISEAEFDRLFDDYYDGGSETQYSISETNDGRAVAVVDNDILSGIDTSSWDKAKKEKAKHAAKTALLAFKEGIHVNGISYKVNKKSRDEFARSNDTERLYKQSKETFADKMRAAENADDIITATTEWARDGKLKHPRTDNFVDFLHGNVLIRARGNEYKASIVVGVTEGGEYVFYDVTDMTPTTFTEKEEPSSAAAASTNAASAIQEDSSDSSIRADDRNVNMESVPKAVLPGGENIDDKNIGKHTATGESQRSRYQEPWTDPTQPDVSGESVVKDGLNVKKKYSVGEQASPEVPAAVLPGGEERSANSRDTMPLKARRYLERSERALLERLGSALSVPPSAKREYLSDIVREISDEYLRDGRVSRETLDRLFDRAYDEGVAVDDEYYKQYRQIKEHLRTQGITISAKDKGDIADWNDFRRCAFGTLRIVNEGGLPVDSAYIEMQDMAPELFPADITHPADQLMRMFEVARGIERVEKSLEDYYGGHAEEFKRWARNDFESAILNSLSELSAVKRFADERSSKKADAQALTSEADVAEAYKQLKEARKAYEKAAAKNLLTDHDNVQVGRLLRSEIQIEHLDPANDNVRGITAVYQSKLEYERLLKLIREWNVRRRGELRAKADDYLHTANEWKDKKRGIFYERETMERNIEDIVKDRTLAKNIIAEYFKPVHDAQAESNRLKNKYRDRVLALQLSTKQTKAMINEGRVSEAHAVQLLGEALDNIKMLENSRGRLSERDGKSLEAWKNVVQSLWENNPQLDRAKIEGAVSEFRKIYDELFEMMNKSRLRNGYEPVNYRKGYFPHFQPESGDGIMSLFGRALGIGTEVSALPTTINGMTHTFRPGIQWFANAQERLGHNTAFDAVDGFDRYIEAVADVIHQTDNIQKLRALGSQIRYRSGDEGIKQQVDEVYADQTLSEQDKQNRIEKIYESGRYTLSNFIVELEEYTNLLANKKSRHDRTMEQRLGRDMYRMMKNMESRVAANMVAINAGSWLTNFIPLTQGWAQLGSGQLLKGMWQTLRAYRKNDGIADASSFLTNRRGSEPMVKTWAQRTSAVLSSPMEFIDHFTADTLVRARYNQNLAHGLSEAAAMSDADSFAASVIADRSKGAMPTLFSQTNPLTKLFTQFQLEVNNQLGYLFKDIPRETKEKGILSLVASLLKFFIGAWLYDEVYEYFIGRRPALDPIGILNDTVGDLTGYELPNLVELGLGALRDDMPSFETEKKNTRDAVSGFFGNVAAELPFVGGLLDGGRMPISSAFPNVDNLLSAATSDTWDSKKRLATLTKEISAPLTYLMLPFGGGQLKKIYQGLDATLRGGSYTVDKDGADILQYPVYNDEPLEFARNLAQSVVFGKTSLQTGRDWVESGFKNLGAKESAVYQAMTELKVPDEEAFELLKAIRDTEKTETETAAEQKRETLRESEISGVGKSALYYGLLASENERELMNALTDKGADMGAVTEALMGIRDAETLTGVADGSGKRNAILEAALTDDEKVDIYRFAFGTRQDDGTYTSSRDDEIMVLMQGGMDIDTILRAEDEFSRISDEYDSAEEKATEFSRWVNSQAFSEDEAQLLRDSQYSTKTNYDALMAAGIPDNDAYKLAKELNELEPLDGAETVSDIQRYQSVTKSGLSAEVQMGALGAMMDEAEYKKLQAGYQYGVSPDSFVTFKSMQPDYDADGNGSYKQAEVTAALDAMTAPVGVKAALWQMANKSWKSGKNPFSTSVGQQVYEAMQTEDAPGGFIELPS